MSKPANWVVYILQCADQTLYTGITNNLDHRINEHENGTGAKYTRGRAPLKLIYSETHSSRSQASKREVEIKSFDRARKLRLASAGYPTSKSSRSAARLGTSSSINRGRSCPSEGVNGQMGSD